MTQRQLMLAGALFLLTGVAAGAFGSHALKQMVSADRLLVWQTAVLYQLIHGLGLLVIAAMRPHYPSRCLAYAGLFLLAGILIFSGSLYTLVLTDLSWLGAITPIGGVSFMLGWASVAWSAKG